TVSVTPVDDAAVVTGLAANPAFTENGAAVVLSPGVVVTDVDSTLLTGAQVAITGGFVAGATLTVDTTGTAITASYDGATGVLTLTGVASVADYQAALASVTFGSTTQRNGSRTIGWTVDDGSTLFHQSLPETTAMTVKGLIIPPPLFTDPGAQTTSAP